MERWIQMHYQIRERDVAMEISRSRELFYWIGSFYAVSLIGMVSRFQSTRRPAILAPVLPMSFVVAYFADAAYGSKAHRIRGSKKLFSQLKTLQMFFFLYIAEAEMIMQHEPELLEWPCGLPTVSSIDQARVEMEIEKKLHPATP